ncbi:MAG: class I SAM-dependent methyltransferase [Wenzhouxiangellaceae bacterium]|nr:class I SAM-dependent methyltransferase [Wenzhouxiangellaceae bacterium]
METTMAESQLQEQIASARAYEELFVPALFRQWAPTIAEVTDARPGKRVLDVACGTGILGRELALRVDPSGSVAGLDIMPGMIEVAREIAPEIEWKLGAAEKLPFPDRSFDIVVSQFGLMFFSDRTESLREMLRVLVPGGRLAVTVWDSLDNNPAYAAEVAVLERVAGKAAANALRAPFVLGNKAELEQLGRDAGLSESRVGTHIGVARFPAIRSLVEADLRGWLPVLGVELDEGTIQRVLGAADRDLHAYVDEGGEAVFEVSAHVLSGMRNHHSGFSPAS